MLQVWQSKSPASKVRTASRYDIISVATTPLVVPSYNSSHSAQALPALCSVLAEIHSAYAGQLAVHSEQTHCNLTWLAASQNRMDDVLALLDQGVSVGWTHRPYLLAVRFLLSSVIFEYSESPCLHVVDVTMAVMHV